MRVGTFVAKIKAMSTRIISEATITKYLNKEHIFIKEMKKCAERKPQKWDDCFDGDLDPETMQPAVEFCIRDKCYLINRILKFLPEKICDRIWGKQYIVFFAVFWAKDKSREGITRERDKLNSELSRLKNCQKTTKKNSIKK